MNFVIESQFFWEINLAPTLILYLEIIQQLFVVVLRGQAGISQIFVYGAPMLDAPIVEHTELFANDEWHMATLQTLPE